MRIMTSSVIYGLVILCFTGVPGDLLAQDGYVYDDMTLGELLDVDVVVTASKSPEDLFETPLSVTIIKQEEINRSGASSIMEALRLSPGMIVREVTPGNWDIHIRGFEDITKNAYVSLPFNTTTLVMIDNRVVYSYFTGGTFWETLPIDIQDVERIEIVRGPASALYGSNAVTGVINIITDHASETGFNSRAQGAAAQPGDYYLNSAIGYNWDQETRISLSGHMSHRERHYQKYYDWSTEAYVDADSLNMFLSVLKDPQSRINWDYEDYRDSLGADQDVTQDETLSLEKQTLNFQLSHNMGPSRNMNLSAGLQHSISQSPGFLNFVTPLSMNHAHSVYSSLRLNWDNLSGMLNAYQGEYLADYPSNSHKNTNYEAQVEYQLNFTKGLFRPGFSYRTFNYNSPLTYAEPYDLMLLNADFKDEEHHLKIWSGYFLSEYRPTPKLRVIGGLRLDQFNINKNVSLNHELALTYRLNKSNLFRLVQSRATRSPFIFDSFLNAKLAFGNYVEFPGNSAPLFVRVEQELKARPDQEYLTNDTQELSWRRKLRHGFEVDLETFFSRMSNVVVSNEYRQYQMLIQLNDAGVGDSLASARGFGEMYFENFDFNSEHLGVSASLSGQINSQWDLKLFANWQKTTQGGTIDQEFITTGTSTELDTAEQVLISTIYSFTNPTQWSAELTPTFYGGVYLNFQWSERTNLNLNLYATSKQVFGGLPFYNITADISGIYFYNYETIPSNMNLNFKGSHLVGKRLKLFVIGKNLLGRHREYAFVDPIYRSVFIGFEW